MRRVSRRTVLKHLAALPIAAPILSTLACRHSTGPAAANLRLAPETACPRGIDLAGPNNPGVNVFLHGLFVISTKNGRFDLYPPEVKGHNPHVYRAGKWRQEQDLPRKSSVSLDGINPGTQPSFPTTSHFLIPAPAAATFDPSQSYLAGFQIPFPSSPSSVEPRRVLQKPSAHDFFCQGDCSGSCDDLGMRPSSVPLLYVFVFPQSQFTSGPGGVKLNVTQAGNTTAIWSYAPNSSDLFSYDLHIDASPSQCPDPNHLCEALDTLDQMFNPPLTLKLYDPKVKPNAVCAEEYSLEERDHACGEGKGGQVANCMAFLLGG